MGHHSTSDDSTLYRPKNEIESWMQKDVDPIGKFCDWYNSAFECFDMEALKNETKKELLHCLKLAESKKKPPISALFSDIYDKLTPELELQKKKLDELLKEYPNSMDISSFLK